MKGKGEIGVRQWQYKAILCDYDVFLLELIQYIYLNPIRAKAVDDHESQGIIKLEDCIQGDKDLEITVESLEGTLKKKGGKKYSSRIAWRYFRVFLIELLVFL